MTARRASFSGPACKGQASGAVCDATRTFVGLLPRLLALLPSVTPLRYSLALLPSVTPFKDSPANLPCWIPLRDSPGPCRPSCTRKILSVKCPGLRRAVKFGQCPTSES